MTDHTPSAAFVDSAHLPDIALPLALAAVRNIIRRSVPADLLAIDCDELLSAAYHPIHPAFDRAFNRKDWWRNGPDLGPIEYLEMIREHCGTEDDGPGRPAGHEETWTAADYRQDDEHDRYMADLEAAWDYEAAEWRTDQLARLFWLETELVAMLTVPARMIGVTA